VYKCVLLDTHTQTRTHTSRTSMPKPIMVTRRTHSYKKHVLEREHILVREHMLEREHTSRKSKQKPNMMTRRTHLHTFMNTHELNTYLESVQAKAQQDCNGFRVKGLGTSSTSKQKPHRITMAIAYCHRRSSILPGCKRDLLQKEKRPTIEANET
jgi:hypothetical protein